MNKNFYDEKIEQINKLIKQKNYSNAYLELLEELKMPYVPKVYLEKFENIKIDLERHLFDKGNDISKDISIKELIKFLFSSNQKLEAIAMENLSKHNLRPIMNKIKQRIESWSKNEALKRSYLFELLVNQEIDIDLLIDGVKVNPKHDLIINNEVLAQGVKIIDELTTKFPQASDLAKNELYRYLMIIFPETITDISSITQQIVNIVLAMFNENIKLSSEEEKIKSTLFQEKTKN